MLIAPIVYPGNRLACTVYRPSGTALRNEVDLDNSLDPLHLEVRIAMKVGPGGGTTFSYRLHGTIQWIEAYSVPGVSTPQIETIKIGGFHRDDPFYVDLLVLSTDLVKAAAGQGPLPLSVIPEKRTLDAPERPVPQLRDQIPKDHFSQPRE